MKSLITILLSFSLGLKIHAQEIIPDQNWEEEEEKQSSFQYYSQNPININAVTEAEWLNLAILSKEQIREFFLHRIYIKEFISIYELQVIPLFDLTTLAKLKPFIRCLPLQSKLLKSTESSNLLILRTEFTMEQKKGFSPPDSRSKVRYQGPPMSQLLRYKGQLNSRVHYGFLSEKDAGEPDWLDFYSAFIEIKPNGFIEKIILGDFLNQWGQGLVASGGFSLGKSYESIKATQRFHLGGIPYSSAGENGFYRGIHGTFRISSSLRLQAYHSSRKLDASIQADSLGNLGYKSLDIDGYHRTESEIKKKENLGEESQGLSFQFSDPNTAISWQLNHQQTLYAYPKLASELSYKKSDWSGQGLQNTSISAQFPFKNIRFMGELALTWPKSIAIIQGAAFSLSKKMDFSYLARVYSPSYYSPKSQGFGESNGSSNEYGLFIGNQWQLTKRSKISSYVDVFLFPGMNYQLSKENSMGWEILSRYQWERRNQYRFFMQLKWTSKENDAPKPRTEIIRKHQIQWSIDLNKIINKRINLHSRLMLNYVQSKVKSEIGMLILQDISYKIQGWKFQVRLAHFNTSDYDARLYAYEMGVPYTFTLPAHSGKGMRAVFVLESHVHAKINISIKLSQTRYFDREEIGSSYDLIQGNHKTDVTGQVVISI